MKETTEKSNQCSTYYKIGGLEAKVEHLFSSVDRILDKLISIDKKIEDLNTFKWKLVGICVGICTTLSALITILTLFLNPLLEITK